MMKRRNKPIRPGPVLSKLALAMVLTWAGGGSMLLN